MIKKSAFIVAYLLIHLFILRGVRTELFAVQVELGNFETVSQKIEGLSVQKLGTRLVHFNYEQPDFQKVWQYKLPLGFYFLIAMLALILIGAELRFFYLLLAVHISVLIISAAILVWGMYASVWLLSVADLLSRYFIPFGSVGIACFAFINKRQHQVDE